MVRLYGCSPDLFVDGGGFCGEPCRVGLYSFLTSQEAVRISQSAMQSPAASSVDFFSVVSVLVPVFSNDTVLRTPRYMVFFFTIGPCPLG